MRARVFIGFVIVLELALIAGPRWARMGSAPEGYTSWGELGAVRLAAPDDWRAVPEAMGGELQLALVGDAQEGGPARRLSVSAPIPVEGIDVDRFFEVIRSMPAGPTEDAQVVADGPALVRGARAAYRREVLITAPRQQDGQPATFHFSRVWLLTPDAQVVELQLIVEEPALGDPTPEILRSISV